jgi:putative ABC transport system permease protein
MEAEMLSVVRDLRLGGRALAKRPGSAVAAVVALGTGIGLCTMMFSIIYGVYFRGLGVPEADRLLIIYRADPARGYNELWVQQHDFYDWREEQRSFQGLAGYYFGTVNLSGTEGPERFSGGFVSANAFDLLRERPILGRSFQVGDDAPGAPLSVLLGYRVWEDRYGADPGVLGKVVKVNGEQAAIIGVMPEGFRFPHDQDLWVPLRDERSLHEERDAGPSFRVFGRLQDGVGRQQGQREFDLIAERLGREYPDTNQGIGVRLVTFVEANTSPFMAVGFGTMLLATVLVLLIACSNVANLLLARAVLRTRECAVRTAIGASRFHAVIPFFSEAVLLSATGAIAGVGLAYLSVGVFRGATADVSWPYYMQVKVDLPILGFVVLLGVLASLVSGLAPAVRVLKTDVSTVLKDEARGSSSFELGKLSRALVVGEVALSLALLVAAGLMGKSIARLGDRGFNFAGDDVFTGRIQLLGREYDAEQARIQFYRDLLARLKAIPGVESAALGSELPGRGAALRRFAVEGASYAAYRDHPVARRAAVTPGFFEALDAGLLRGRSFEVRDDEEAPGVAIVNQRFADLYFPGENPIGRRIREVTRAGAGEWKTIVGLAPNLKIEGFYPGQDSAGYYVPLAQHAVSYAGIAVEARTGRAVALAADLRRAVEVGDPEIPVYEMRTLDEVIDRQTWAYRVFGALFVVFGFAALFLASVGLYGVLAFAVNRRTHEFGIRMALGAQAANVVGLVLRQGAIQLAIGLALGLGLSLGLSRAMAIFTFQVSPTDPVVFGFSLLFVVGVALLAGLVPALRATRVDPTVALKSE